MLKATPHKAYSPPSLSNSQNYLFPSPHLKNRPTLSIQRGQSSLMGGWTVNVDWEGMLPIEGAVIIVEDDPTLRSLMTSILVEVGAETLAFDTADDALTFLLQSHERCPLVIVDQGLPGQIQGIEFIEMIQSRWPTTAAILTSGYLINPLDLPASAIYLHKPWSLDELVTSVAAALQPGKPLYKR